MGLHAVPDPQVDLDVLLRLQPCPNCTENKWARGDGCICEGTGVLDGYGRPFHAPPPFDRWEGEQLVALAGGPDGRWRLQRAETITHGAQEEGMSTPEHEGAPERRLTPSERLHEVTMAALGRTPTAPESSVTISRNAKGVFQFEVTVRGADADACASEAERLANELAAAHPYPEGE